MFIRSLGLFILFALSLSLVGFSSLLHSGKPKELPSSFITAATLSPLHATDTNSEDTLSTQSVFIQCATGERGNGTIINSKGVILTAAHLGQALLEGTCTVYGKNIRADAQLLYLPSAWMKNHGDLKSPVPLGTGENDYAFLLINTTESLSSIPLELTAPKVASPVFISTYGVGAPEGSAPISSSSTISKLFTFEKTTPDLFAFRLSPNPGRGVSGGGVRDQKGNLIGVIVTLGDDPKELRAITLGHIERSLKSTGGFGISFLTEGSLTQKAAAFETTVSPILRSMR